MIGEPCAIVAVGGASVHVPRLEDRAIGEQLNGRERKKSQ
jgi:hypothetical protein